jgi:type II secretory pathway component PulC
MFNKILGLLRKATIKKEDEKDSLYYSWLRYCINISFVLFVSFTLASVASTFLVPYIQKIGINAKVGSGDLVKMKILSPNLRNIKKNILKRNIFNKDGEFPDEDKGKEKEKVVEKFNLKGPCKTSTLKLTLLGTIAVDNNNSIAIIKDGEYIDYYYKNNKILLGYPRVKVVKILQNIVILNNAGTKECLYSSKETNVDKLLTDSQIKAKGKTTYKELKSSWVEAEIGPGYGRILKTANYGPSSDGSEGLKMFRIVPGSLFDSIGLKVGDLITAIGEESISFENGFKLYQVFLEQSDVSLSFIRNNVKNVIKIKIK